MPSDRRWAIRLAVVAGYALLALALTWPLARSATTHLPLGTEPVVSVPALNAWTVWWNADQARYAFREYWHAPIFYPSPYAFAFSEAQPTTLLVAPLAAAAGPALAYNVYLLAVLTLNGLVAYRLLRRVGLALLPATLGGVIVETLPMVHWQLGVLQLTTLCGALWVIDRIVALRDGERESGGAGERGTRDGNMRNGAGSRFPSPWGEGSGVRGVLAATSPLASLPIERGGTGVRNAQRQPHPLTPGPSPQGEGSLIGTPPPPLSPSPAPPPRLRDAALLGLAAALCYAACNYFGLFLSILLPLSLLPLVWGRWLDWRFWLLLAASGVVAAGLTAPILLAQFAAKEEYVWTRSQSLLFSLSAQPRDYLNPYRKPLIEGPNLRDPDRPLWVLGTGPLKLVLAGLGVVAGMASHGRRRWTLFLLLFGLAAFVLSLGPTLEITPWANARLRASADEPSEGWVPYRMLAAVHPGLELARSPFRFAFFVHLAVALLAANVLEAIWSASHRLTASWRSGRRRIGLGLAAAIVLAVGGLAAGEVVPHKQRLYALPSLDQAWINWLKANSDPARPILCLPFPMGSTVEDYERTALFMVEQIGHRRPMADGYSGFFPPEFLRLKESMNDFPDEVVIDELRERKVGHVVSADAEWSRRSPSLRLAFRDDDAKVSVYEVLPPFDAP